MNNRNNSTIYVGNLPHAVTDQLLLKIFGNFGQCASCHIIRDYSSLTFPYAFIEYTEHQYASLAIAAMDEIYMWTNQLKVNWAAGINGAQTNTKAPTIQAAKVDPKNVVNIFVGDIGPNVDEQMLRDGFSDFGQIVDVKVVRYPTGQSRGFGFIGFASRVDAEKAIQSMHRTWFHNKTIKCNWASHNGTDGEQFVKYTPRPYELVYKEAPITNCNVYVAGDDLDENMLRLHFEEFGRIDNVKCYPDKGHAFINFQTHEAAARAISQRHGYKIYDTVIKCNWGKDNFVPNASATATPTTMTVNNQMPPPLNHQAPSNMYQYTYRY